MSHSPRIAVACLCVAALFSSPAWAEADVFGLGSGKDGALELPADAVRTINAYAQVKEDVAEGDTSVSVDATAGFGADDVVLVWRTTGMQPLAPDTELVNLARTPVGTWELARIQSVSGTQLTFTQPLLRSYAALVSQVVRVPQYTNVTLQAGSRLEAQPWNGSTGGILMFLATGTVTNDGRITASGAGFRGGSAVKDPDGIKGCTSLDEPSPQGQQRGEGLVISRYGSTGRGRMANGAGGGVCLQAGGGGGGHGGPGGQGGSTSAVDGPHRAVGGEGGTALAYSLLDRLSLGGGGGAGHGLSLIGTTSDGARGGGVIVFRARQLSGGGSIEADGATATTATLNAGGGGGAGGTISIRLVEGARCGGLAARGGAGADVMTVEAFMQLTGGTGGGGGGGRVLLQAASLTGCNPDVSGGGRGIFRGEPVPVPLTATAGVDGTLEVKGTGLRIPAPPSITAPASGATVGTTKPLITGNAPSGLSVIVTVDAVRGAPVLADGTGFQFTPAKDLSPGLHQVRATVEVEGLSSPPSATVTFTVDTTPPDTVVDTPAEGVTVTTRTPLISGLTEPGVDVKVSLDAVLEGTSRADSQGRWTFTPSRALADGPYTVTARAVDAAGNEGPDSEPRHFSVDATPPAAPVFTSPTEGSVLKQRQPTITGTADADSRVSVTVDGVPRGQVDVQEGRWSLTVSVELDEGPHTVRATATDAAGNTRDAFPDLHFRVDWKPPAPPTLTAPDADALLTNPIPTIAGNAEPGSTVRVSIDSEDKGETLADAVSGTWTFVLTRPLGEGRHYVQASATDEAGNSSTPSEARFFSVDTKAPEGTTVTTPADNARFDTDTLEVSGRAEAGATVTLVVDNREVRTVTAYGDGTWSATPPPLSDGPHRAWAFATDKAGNRGPTSNPVAFTVDLLAPGAPVLETPRPGAWVNSKTPVITGTAEKGSTVTVLLGNRVLGTAQANVLGEWTYVPTSLDEGLQQVSARATDAVGHTGARSDVREFTVDTVAPAVPLLVTPSAGAVVNLSFSRLTGSAEAGSHLLAQLDGNEAGHVDAGTNGLWTLTLRLALVPGEHTLKVQARDDAGNTSDATEVRFTVDGTPPAAPVLTTPANGARLNTATPGITGEAEPGSSVQVFINSAHVGSVKALPSGAWSFTPPASLGDAEHTVKARAVDPSQNEGDFSDEHHFTVDTRPPDAPVLTTPTAGALLSESKPRLSGTAEPLSTVTVLLDRQPLGTVQADGEGGWSLTPEAPLEDAEHTVSVGATDAVGNSGPFSTPVRFRVDTVTPDTFITPRSEAGVVLELSASEEAVTFECSLDGAAFEACASPVTLPELPEGAHAFEARARDAVGHVDPTPARQEWSVKLPHNTVEGGGTGCAAGGGSLLTPLGALVLAAWRSRRRRTPHAHLPV